ncbi:transmembrane protein 107 like isoform X1 [Oreochromis aureus]|uniref:transmembrane protein 107 like isoform X1 n=1 Tax=Oreochromis aureus TaxID=47969 RepID=UPI00195307D5|nr:transmembrane protein 107 like isoform X1 [Oreochromis aureus]
MSAVSSLVPARFLTIIAHLVIVITIFWSRENNVKACLPLDFTQEQYDTEDRRLVVALSVTLGLFAIELAGFFSGVSMFNCSQGLLSTGVHASASVALLFFLFEQWECHIYWWILAICRLVYKLAQCCCVFPKCFSLTHVSTSTVCPLQRISVFVFFCV